MSIYLKINDVWGEYAWLCADTGIEVLKTGATITGNGRKLTYEDKEGKEHQIELTNIKTGQVIDPITNKIKKTL